MPEPPAASHPRLPVVHLREARPYLQAPFPAQSIGVFARREPRQPDTARAVFFVPIRQVEARLTYVFGLGNWTPGIPSVIDARSLSCSLTVLGATLTAVGQGADRLAQAANATKHCALLIGLGAYLGEIEPITFPIGEQTDQVLLGSDGRLILPRTLEERAREHYQMQIDRIRDHFGPPLEHAAAPWNRKVVPLGRARGLAALAAGVLDRTERQDAPRPLLRTGLEALLAASPGGLAACTAARRAPTPDSGAVFDEGDPGELVEVDFGALRPKPREWVA